MTLIGNGFAADENLPITVRRFRWSAFYGRYAWVDTVEDANLSDNLKRLSLKDLELLTLIVIDGYSQSELARKTGTVQSVISRKLSRIKKLLK